MLRTATLTNPGGFTGPPSQVVELGSSHAAMTQHLDMVDARAMHWEGTLDPNAVRSDPANRKVLVDPPGTSPDDDAFERLNSFPRALDNLHENADVITRAEIRHVILEIFLFDTSDDVNHISPLSLMLRPREVNTYQTSQPLARPTECNTAALSAATRPRALDSSVRP